MSAEELLPGYLPGPFWGWFDAMLFQNIGNRVVCQQVSEVGKCALNPAITPASIFLGHASDQRSNFSRGSWSSGGSDECFHRISWRSAFGARPTESPESR